jgi:pimeloyl-ACP methyl ester carboxylesterase
VKFAHAQQQFFPKAQVHLLPDSGHFPFADDPEGVAAAVVPFLQMQLQGSAGEPSATDQHSAS